MCSRASAQRLVSCPREIEHFLEMPKVVLSPQPNRDENSGENNFVAKIVF